MSRKGQVAIESDLIDVKQVLDAYYQLQPNVDDPSQKVVFGTSGHRGASLNSAFNEAHIITITAAIIEYRNRSGITGALFLGFDTHLLSLPAFMTTLEVLGAAGVDVCIDSHVTLGTINRALDGNQSTNLPIWTPTPAISHAVLRANSDTSGNLRADAFAASIEEPSRAGGLADGIVITPSHNPPSDGGYKYNPAHGGPADTNATAWIASRANELLSGGYKDVPRIPFERALDLDTTHRYDFRTHYVDDLENIIDMEAIRNSGVKIGADPLGGAATEYWGVIAEKYGLNLTVVNETVDPRWPFMTLDWDEKIRMDCSSPYSMQGLVNRFLEDASRYDIGTGNDADSDRHGIVVPNAHAKSTGAAGVDPNNAYTPGLMNPNHFLAVAIDYLFSGARANWPSSVAVGKTLVSSSLIDRISGGIGRKLVEVPVGLKWFVPGLISGELGFGGEESAGASFLRKNGKVWTTDKDGLLLDLLASEITASTGKNPAEHHRELIGKYGESWYERIDAPASLEEKDKLKKLSPQDVSALELAGEKITAKLTKAPGNDAGIGGLKVVTDNAWFAARPSGTENVYKIYAESFISPEHLAQVQTQAKEVVAKAIS
ncbi:MAG: phosphoglucomutase (alpha-D-glucose-1,6-bisphosphate-dependent) [Candidatus Ancillula sp.]|jgi:phosphoglucomutase|nr:phosphoglucomutase (alpha-D-glucose-1,6-bisphosphate-dependent) [Candidatus Ancillula sp.]